MTRLQLLTLSVTCALLLPARLFAQQKTLDIIGIHQLVDESISENKLQVTARNQQALATANEQANLTLLDKLKGLYRTLQQRYNSLGTAINVADLGLYATPVVRQIVAYQAQIIQLAAKNPALIAIGYQSELQFASQAEDLMGYVAGLMLSYGDVNQMKASDRKLLFDYVLLQLSHLQQLAGNLVNVMQYSSLSALLRAANPFQNFIDADAGLARNILQNAKALKP